MGKKKFILRARNLIPKQNEGNNHTSKINVFPVLHTIFLLLGGQNSILCNWGEKSLFYECDVSCLSKARATITLLGPLVEKMDFHNASFENPVSVPVERVKQRKQRLSTRSTVTANRILKRVAIKNSIHYSKQNTANATRVTADLASLGQQTSHSLQLLCFVPCNVIYSCLLRTGQ